MHPEQIKAQMRMSGWTQAMLADDMGVSVSAVYQAITGMGRSSRIQQRISEILGQPVQAIWPNLIMVKRTRAQIDAHRATTSQQQQ